MKESLNPMRNRATDTKPRTNCDNFVRSDTQIEMNIDRKMKKKHS